MPPLYIFDLDGTLALIDHRRHFVTMTDGRTAADWRAFFLACTLDEPNWPVIGTLGALIKSGADVWIWSGRSSEVMNQTVAWLQRYLPTEVDPDELQLCMRIEGDFTPDEQLKEQWLQALSEYDRKRLVAVFDDRDKVVSMWRRNGVACFQVAPGEF